MNILKRTLTRSVLFIIMASLSISLNATAQVEAKKPTFAQLFSQAEWLIKDKKLDQAAIQLNNLARSVKQIENREKTLRRLAEVLTQLKLKHSAAMIYLDLSKSKDQNIMEDGLTALFHLADELDSESFIEYSLDKISKLKLKITNHPRFIYRYGEYLLKNRKHIQAYQLFSELKQSDENYFKAKYSSAIALIEAKKLKEAQDILENLVTDKSDINEVNYNRNAAIIGLARLNYKNQKWDDAIKYYREVPKDSELWHNVIFEMSWTNFRKGAFREVLGNLSSIHSSFYEDYFLPESVLLRALVYMSICHTQELSKTTAMFKDLYDPMRATLIRFLNNTKKYDAYYSAAKDKLTAIREDIALSSAQKNQGIPLAIARTITRNPAIQRSLRYLKNIRDEKDQMKKLGKDWLTSPVGIESAKNLERRIEFAKRTVGLEIKKHLEQKRKEFAEFYRQLDFISYETAALNKKLAKEALIENNQKKSANQSKTVDADLSRNYFLNRGIEYYPFKGEYWLDEIGNYHFIGKSRCGN